MKKFKGLKKLEAIISDAEQQGWEVDATAFEENGSDWIYLRDIYDRLKQVAVNVTSGHFYVYEPFQKKPTATHMSSEFDNEEWYNEILNLLYVS
ncbi:hypothetical protein AZI98_08570 [Aeribacillus pallidus]|uniref:Uncharacterized protein n=1 Tax=Aeribacillus pallidus TaxID=33936 RepID=A0A165XWI0_9BACI|nr:hypothetical protein [Aeribacillus pallidus]KZN96476.1 hypothetical protein AZI98_08570 [Aeribacillus pallidus]